MGAADSLRTAGEKLAKGGESRVALPDWRRPQRQILKRGGRLDQQRLALRISAPAREAFGRVLRERPQLPIELCVAGAVAGGRRLGPPAKPLAGHCLVQHRAQRENIRARIRLLPLYLLRRHVLVSADNFAFIGQRLAHGLRRARCHRS